MRKKILFSVVIASAFFMILETAVRVVHIYHPLFEDKTFVYQQHPVFDHWHVPNASETSRADTGEYSVHIRTNSHGMPGLERSIDKGDGIYRIALLGDSFVEGFTTEEESTISALLEGLLNKSIDQKFEVLNFGCSSFSPSLEYYLLLDLAANFRPDMVVLMFHITDVTDDWRYEKKKALDLNGKAIGIDGTKEKSAIYQIFEKSSLLRTVVQKIKKLQKQGLMEESQSVDLSESYYAMFKDSYSPSDEKAWELSKSYLKKIKDWSDEAGVPFLLVVIPVGPQVEDVVEGPDGRHVFPPAWRNLESVKMQEILQDWAREAGVDFVDLLHRAKIFKKQIKEGNLFYPMDQHFTATGNEIAADAIYEKIESLMSRN